MTGGDDEDGRFSIPARPERRYPRAGGVEYEGGTVFVLEPVPPQDDARLRELVESVLEGEPYTYGDWFDLPMPLYLVHDGDTGDVFRVSVRDGRVRLHVLPATDPEGLAAIYRRLRAADDDLEWSLTRRVEEP